MVRAMSLEAIGPWFESCVDDLFFGFFFANFFQVFSKNCWKKFRLQIYEICIEIVKKRKKNLNWLILKNEKGGAACRFRKHNSRKLKVF